MKTSLPLFAFAIAAISMTSACSKGADSQHGDTTRNGSAEDTSVIAQDSARLDEIQAAFDQASVDTDKAAAAVRQFGASLYQQLQGDAAREGNLAISPWSIESAMLMTSVGAHGNTLSELLHGLGFGSFDEDAASAHKSFGALTSALLESARETDYDGEKDDDRIFNAANSIWVAEQLRSDLRPEFQSTLRDIYLAEVHNAPFQTDTEAARKRINHWVEEKTDDKIEDLISEGILSPDTSMVLTNAVSFDADWQYQFEESNTRDDQFFRLDDSTSTVRMMHQTLENTRYWEGEHFVGVELPYEDGAYAMSVLVPTAGNFTNVRDSLFADGGFDALFPATADRQNERVEVALPKFKFRWSNSLAEALKGIGIQDAFTRNADFSGMFVQGRELISDVIHEVYIDVDEDGTEAAAATAVVMMRATAVAPQARPKQVRADRPFLFVIHDTDTRTPVFMGQVTDPTATR